MNEEKLNFLKAQFIPLLKKLKGDEKGSWGVLNAQQMVEHFSDSVRISSGKLIRPQIIEGEMLEKYRAFMLSEEPFKVNTKNPLMDENGAPLRHANMEDAIRELQTELKYFFTAYEGSPSLTASNPFFGELDYAGQVHLLHKHATHHLKQFGLIENQLPA